VIDTNCDPDEIDYAIRERRRDPFGALDGLDHRQRDHRGKTETESAYDAADYEEQYADLGAAEPAAAGV